MTSQPIVGEKYRFKFDDRDGYGDTLCERVNGQVVTVLFVTHAGPDDPQSTIYKILAENGCICDAFEEELEELQ